MASEPPSGQAPGALEIRQAVFADLGVVSTLLDDYRRFYGRASDMKAARAFLQARFEHGQSVVFMALDGATPVGFTQLYPSFSSVSLARVFILNDLFVAESHRRAGVGARLLDAASHYARSMGAVRLSLNTDVKNTNAQALYEAKGWKRDQEYFAFHLAL